MDVGDWLRNLGLGQYENAFRENDIDLEVLPELTEADFEKVGVSLGHRKRLLKAIAGIKAPPDEPQAALAASAPVGNAAERRQLTVMFCDLVGSTAISARLDPEDMRAIIGAYHKCCATLITSNGGFVAKYMGDGVLAYFGYPQAHEHDAERAVRAGLAITDAAPKLESAVGAPLHVRVGIATGIVVVGDLLGSGESQERGVVGDTPNLAARLQGLAKPDSVVIAEGTRKLLGNLFELDDLGPQDLKGVAGPTRAFAPLRESSQESRFEALHAGGLTAMVGREEETDLLLRRWSKAKAGEGQLVLLSGEPGIGKSRLPRRCTSGCAARRMSGCAISARRSTATARSTRLSPRSNAPPASPATTRPRCGSTSSKGCRCRPRRHRKSWRYWPNCCRCRRRAIRNYSSARRARRCAPSRRCCANWRNSPAASRCR
jgi:class 3 adenylate cyclase